MTSSLRSRVSEGVLDADDGDEEEDGVDVKDEDKGGVDSAGPALGAGLADVSAIANLHFSSHARMEVSLRSRV